MVKTFAKMFVGLSTTIIATRRRLVLILHLEAKYAKIDCKNEIYVKNWVRSTWTAKVNYGKKSMVKVNPQSKSMMTSADVAVMTSPRADVSWCRSGAWRRVKKVLGE